MVDKVQELERRYEQVNEALSDPNVHADLSKVVKLGKEAKELEGKLEVGRKYKFLYDSLEAARDLLKTENDEELREMAKEEIASLEPQLEAQEEALKRVLIPKDPNDDRNVIMEIRSGTGGDEAALFAGDLFTMYKRYCETHGFKLEVTDFHEGTAGGYRDITCNILGPDAYGIFKFESGVHRVQRVPDTETQGRVHTSAATVAVLPEAEDIDVELHDRDIRKDTFMSSGNGGQSVNTTYSAVRLTHIPTGVVVAMQNERSQIKNYEAALKILKARLYDIELQKRLTEETTLRRTLVASGDRSAKIRTYNFPQSRVTDHRIGLTVYNLQTVLAGDLDEFIEALRIEETSRKLGQATAVADLLED